MGALVCAHYSDNFAFEKGVTVQAVVCIACPWMGLVGLPRPNKVRSSYIPRGTWPNLHHTRPGS